MNTRRSWTLAFGAGSCAMIASGVWVFVAMVLDVDVGVMNDLAVWTRPLSSADIAALYAGGCPS